MCHGTFDIVHPGHIRHLMYAKEKADVLIASVTADAHISKGAHRPYVPQELRAANLAAFEFVDYVIVDHNETPIENIRALEPDYFAKGFEYQSSPCRPRRRRRSPRSSRTGARWCSPPATSCTPRARSSRSTSPSSGWTSSSPCSNRRG
jgi:cytidyltransferase-like protein